jgi:hypothetical protein
MSIARPHTVTLSDEEVLALVKFHTNCVRQIPKKLGKALLEERTNFFSRSRTMKILQEEAEAAVEARVARANELLTFIKK